MGFPIIDPVLGDQGKLFGSLFQVSAEPEPRALVQQLLALVKLSQKRWNERSSPKDREILCERIMKSFAEVFGYLSTRSSEFDASYMTLLSQQAFIPYLPDKGAERHTRLEWYRPEDVFFKAENKNSDYASVTETLFRVVDFSPFLARTGVKQEASTKDIFRLMIESPQKVLDSVQQSEGKYRSLLRRVAAHRPFTRVTKEIRESPFLLAYEPPPVDQSEEKENGNRPERSKFKLAKAEDIHIIDNSFFGRMFPVQRAPHESDLEDFYALIGSQYISKHVKKTFDVVGNRRADTKLALAMGERIHERSPLLVSPNVTSRPLVPNAASVLDDAHLRIYEVPELISFFSLGNFSISFNVAAKPFSSNEVIAQSCVLCASPGKSVRSQQTTCCSQPSGGKTNVLYVTKDFDWFDVGFALGELILERCQLEDAFFISSLLEAPLEQLRNRGFPVDRIIKPEPIPEPEPQAPPVTAAPPSKPTSDGEPSSGAKTSSHANSAIVGKDMSSSSAASGDTHPPEKAQSNSQSGTMANIPSNADTTGMSKQEHTSENTSHPDSDSAETAVSSSSLEGFVTTLKQMYPDADIGYIYDLLGASPRLDDVRDLAEEMATRGYPKDPGVQHETKLDKPKASKKLLGSKKLGRVLRSSFGGATNPAPNHAKMGGETGAYSGVGGRAHNTGNDGRPVPPEADAAAQNSMERMLEQTVSRSSHVDSSGISSGDKQISIPQGLDRGQSCEAIPGQNLKPFPGPQQNGKTHNGILVFSARLHPSSEEFLRNHYDVVESFAVVIERLCIVYDLPIKSVCIFHDPSGGTIAFNSAKALHFNIRFFYALHYMQNKHQNRECYSYWFVTTAHELAHHMVSAHNKEHGFYTESYISLYLPRLAMLFGQLGATD